MFCSIWSTTSDVIQKPWVSIKEMRKAQRDRKTVITVGDIAQSFKHTFPCGGKREKNGCKTWQGQGCDSEKSPINSYFSLCNEVVQCLQFSFYIRRLHRSRKFSCLRWADSTRIASRSNDIPTRMKMWNSPLRQKHLFASSWIPLSREFFSKWYLTASNPWICSIWLLARCWKVKKGFWLDWELSWKCRKKIFDNVTRLKNQDLCFRKIAAYSRPWFAQKLLAKFLSLLNPVQSFINRFQTPGSYFFDSSW